MTGSRDGCAANGTGEIVYATEKPGCIRRGKQAVLRACQLEASEAGCRVCAAERGLVSTHAEGLLVNGAVTGLGCEVVPGT